MATLTGNTIKDTYQSLLKVNDNGELAATLQEITDGVGNGSGVSLNTTGDLKAEGTIEFGSLKDTGEAITITKFVDEADGIANNDNDTSIPTSAAIIDYVAAKITEEDLDFAGDSGTGSVDLDSQTFTIGGTANQIETTATGQSLTIAFPSAGVVLPDGSTATTQAISDDSTKVATTAYVKSVLTQEDLDFQGDTGTGSVDLDSEVLDIAGGTGIDTVASGQTLTVNIDSTVATLTGTQTLTNKTINADNNTISNLEVDNLKAGVLDTDLTTVSASDDTLASAKAIKTYVDANITAQDLDITDGTTTSAVDLDSQTMTIQGTANEVEVSLTDQTFTVGLPDTINVNVSGNITGDITGNAGTATALETARDIALSGDVVGSASFDGTANITIAATIQPDSVALGTDTTGDYVANLGTGTGVTIASNTGEGSQPTISVDYGSTANTAVEGDTEITISGTTNQIEITGTANQALGGSPSYTVGLPDDVTIAGSLIVSNDLTVNGTTTTVNTQTLSVEDPLIALAIANDANSVDTGFYAKYSLDSGVTTKFAGLFKDASDTDTFKLFKGLEVEPTTTVDTAGTGYALADIQVAGLEATTIVKTGGSSTEFLKADGSIDSNTYLTAESDTLDAVTTRGNTTTNSIEVGAATITGDLTVDTNTLYVDSTDNRVGIGTTSINSKVQIEQPQQISGAFSNPFIKLSNSAQTDNIGTTAIALATSTADNYGYAISAKRGTSGADSSFIITHHDNSLTGTERMRIDSSGNVGIGTDNPSAGIHVKHGSITTSSDYSSFLSNATAKIVANHSSEYGISIGYANASTDTIGIQSGNTGASRPLSLQPFGGNVGIGTSSPTRTLEVNSGTASDIAKIGNNSGAFTFGYSASLASIDLAASNAFRIRQGAVIPFYINTDSNVGIGTTSPNYRLNLSNSSTLTPVYQQFTNGTTGTTANDGTVMGIDSDGDFIINNLEAKDIKLYTSDTPRMVIDSSGNVKINNGSLELGSEGISSGYVYSQESLYFNVDSNNTPENSVIVFGTGRTGNTGGSELMRIESDGKIAIDGYSNGAYIKSVGSIRFDIDSDNNQTDRAFVVGHNNAASDLFIIKESGNVGIGTSPTAKLTVNGNINFPYSTTGTSTIGIQQSPTNPYSTTARELLIKGANAEPTGASGQAQQGGNVRISAGLARVNTGLGIRAGDVIIEGGLHHDGVGVTDGAGRIIFNTAGTERMRITSGGDFYIGTGASVASSTQGGASFVVDTNDRRTLLLSTQTTSANSLVIFYNTNGVVGTISTSGSSTAYNTTSDYRLKENVVPMEGALDRVDALKPSRFNFIADADKTVDGFLAHEVADVVPEAISGEKDAVETQEYEVSPAVYEDVVHPAVEEVLDDDGNVVTPAQEEYTERVLVSEAVMGTREVPVYQGIDQSKLVPLLTAALQEAHTLIKELTARVEALESN